MRDEVISNNDEVINDSEVMGQSTLAEKMFDDSPIAKTFVDMFDVI